MVQGNGPHAGTASEIREDILLGVRVLSTGVTLWLLGGGREIEDERKTSCKESQVAGFVLPDPPSTPFTLFSSLGSMGAPGRRPEGEAS